jgi:MFS family permease
MFGPTSRALISDSVPINNLGKAMGIWYASRGLGVIIGSLLGSKIAELFSYEISFYLFSLVSLITGIYGIYWFRCNHKNSSVNRNEKVPIGFPIRRVFKELNTNDSISIIFLLAIIALISRGVNDSFVPIYASEILMASTFGIGIINACFNGVCVVMTPILGNLSDKMSRKQVILIALIFMSASFVSYSFVTKLVHLILVIIINAIGYSLLLPSLLAFLTELVPKDIIGSMMGIFGSCEDLGIMIGPLIFSFIWSTSGPIYAFHTITVLLFFGVILAIYLNRKTI